MWWMGKDLLFMSRSHERIYEYDHETEQVNSTKYRNLYDFLMEVGLRQISR